LQKLVITATDLINDAIITYQDIFLEKKSLRLEIGYSLVEIFFLCEISAKKRQVKFERDQFVIFDIQFSIQKDKCKHLTDEIDLIRLDEIPDDTYSFCGFFQRDRHAELLQDVIDMREILAKFRDEKIRIALLFIKRAEIT